MTLSSPKFKKINESFVCENCNASVPSSSATCRDHCPECLYSKHVDNNPGDRSADCFGLLKPVGYEKHKTKGHMILYSCQKCGAKKKNKFLETDKIKPDSFESLIALLKTILFVLFYLKIFSLQAFAQVEYTSKKEVSVSQLKAKESVSLILVGDTGIGLEDQKNVALLMESLCQEKMVDGVIFLGDNFYFNGVSSAQDNQWKTKFEDIYSSKCLKKLPFFASLGNHDYDGNENAQIEYSKIYPNRWVLPHRYYFANFGEILGVAIADSNIPDFCGIPWLCSINWLREKLSNSKNSWNISVGHHPLLSMGKYKDPNKTLWTRRFFLPFLACHEKNSAYLSGHDHSMQHNAFLIQDSCFLNQFVVGSGGAPLYPVSPEPQKTLFAEATFGAAHLIATKQNLQIDFYSALKQQSKIYSWKKSQ
jgi:tartrate-resistant acid phosphatase type 5